MQSGDCPCLHVSSSSSSTRRNQSTPGVKGHQPARETVLLHVVSAFHSIWQKLTRAANRRVARQPDAEGHCLNDGSCGTTMPRTREAGQHSPARSERRLSGPRDRNRNRNRDHDRQRLLVLLLTEYLPDPHPLPLHLSLLLSLFAAARREDRETESCRWIAPPIL